MFKAVSFSLYAGMCSSKRGGYHRRTSKMRRCADVVNRHVVSYIRAMATPESTIVRKTVSLPAALARRVEIYRFETHTKTETEAMCILIEAGLDAIAAAQPKKSKRSPP